MKSENAKRRSCRYFLAAVFLIILCMSTSLTASAAVSVKNIKKASSGSFVKKGSKWIYQYKNGKLAKDCLLSIDGKTYYFSKNGYRQSGWKKIGGSYYYFGSPSEGYMYKNRWLKSANGNYYLLTVSGKTATGWVTRSGKRYYMEKKTGKRLYGWQKIDGKKYYLGTRSEGYMYKNRFLTYKNKIFFLRGSGTPATGWNNIYGNRYYFDAKGRAYTGSHTIKGTHYLFGSSGALISTGADLTLSSDCAILVDASTGKVLYEKNANTKHANASTTKILTCLLALENCSLSETVTASANAAAQEPVKLYMRAGESFKLKDLLFSLMLPSHNDTAVAIAEHISGSTEKFAALMNDKAKSLGCTSTHFVTPNGLDRGLNHYTTARDLSKIARYALKNKTFCRIVNMSSYSFQSLSGTSYHVSSTNSLLGRLPGVTGMKTGYTNKAGYCFVGTVKAKNGRTYVSVVLGAPTSTARWDDSETLLTYAYNQKK